MLHRVPSWVQRLWPAYTWQLPGNERSIYLTFDDGPVPEYTPFVLDTLKRAGNLPATFFCVGENVQRNPDIFRRIIQEGHQVGNHTYNHLKGWQTSQETYLHNVQACQQLMEEVAGRKVGNLLRPPYGRIKKAQGKALQLNYRIIMWTVLSVDYNPGLTQEKCLQNTLKASKPGSIVVFHDSKKASKNLTYVLPRYIEHLQEAGYQFKALPWI